MHYRNTVASVNFNLCSHFLLSDEVEKCVICTLQSVGHISCF